MLHDSFWKATARICTAHFIGEMETDNDYSECALHWAILTICLFSEPIEFLRGRPLLKQLIVLSHNIHVWETTGQLHSIGEMYHDIFSSYLQGSHSSGKTKFRSASRPFSYYSIFPNYSDNSFHKFIYLLMLWFFFFYFRMKAAVTVSGYATTYLNTCSSYDVKEEEQMLQWLAVNCTSRINLFFRQSCNLEKLSSHWNWNDAHLYSSRKFTVLYI